MIYINISLYLQTYLEFIAEYFTFYVMVIVHNKSNSVVPMEQQTVNDQILNQFAVKRYILSDAFCRAVMYG